MSFDHPPRRAPSPRWAPLVALLAALAVGASAAEAASPALAYRKHLQQLIEAHDWKAALAAIDEARTTNYGAQNTVLYSLDKGTVLHFAGDALASDRALDEAELRIEELYTKSLSQAAGTILINDSTQDYAGEPHERALLYVMRALNYASLQRIDDALVEARKLTAFLTQHGERTGMRTYREDAFAQLLSALLFEDAGKLDDARISFEAAAHAYALYARDYGLPLPRFSHAQRLRRQGELVLIHFNGKVPLRASIKSELQLGGPQTARELASGAKASTIAIALPAIEPQPFLIRGSEVRVGAKSASSVAVEPIAAIATRSLDDQYEAIKSRAAARAGSKEAAIAGAGGLARSGGGALGSLVSAASRSAANALEEADTRAWTALPAELRMARLVLPAGVHAVTVQYRGEAGEDLGAETIEGVEIQGGFRTYLQVHTAR